MRRGCVYGLRDPETGELRYVGKTVHKPQQRLNGHVLAANSGGDAPVSHWIRSLGSYPSLTIFVTDVPEDKLELVESDFIRSMRAAGNRLTNATVRRAA